MSDIDCSVLVDTINEGWQKTYNGQSVYTTRELRARIIAIFDDRNCWVDNTKNIQRDINKLEKKLKKYEKASTTS